MIDTRKQRMSMKEAMNPTREDAIKYLKSTVFPQDMSPSTLRAMAINKMAIDALSDKEAPRQMSLDDLETFVKAEMQRHTLEESLILQPILNRIYRMRKGIHDRPPGGDAHEG